MNIFPTASLINRIMGLREKRADAALRLRVAVEGGGCSGFQYKFSFDHEITADDHVFNDVVVTDSVSLPLLEGAEIDFVSTLAGDEFVVKNPNAVSGCGCGVSFSIG
jgi:iron-sulfur cluster insertion protein